MSSTLLATIHIITVNIFLLLYIIKTILLFSNEAMLDKFTRVTKVIEMIISTLFLISGIWLLFILGAVKMLLIIKFILVFISIPVAMKGFKNKNKILAVLSLLMIIGAYGLSEAAKNKPFIPSMVEVNGNAAETEKTGIKTYMANCAMCHGKDGMKMYRDAKDLTQSSLDEASIELMVSEGSKGKMPAFGGTLSNEEITAVSAYILTLRK